MDPEKIISDPDPGIPYPVPYEFESKLLIKFTISHSDYVYVSQYDTGTILIDRDPKRDPDPESDP